MSQDKGSLPEQQKRWTVTTTILIRRIHTTNSEMHRAALTAQGPSRSWAVINSPPLCPSQLLPPEPSMVAHGIEYSVLFGQAGSARPTVSPPGYWWKLSLSWPNPGHKVSFIHTLKRFMCLYQKSVLNLMCLYLQTRKYLHIYPCSMFSKCSQKN